MKTTRIIVLMLVVAMMIGCGKKAAKSPSASTPGDKSAPNTLATDEESSQANLMHTGKPSVPGDTSNLLKTKQEYERKDSGAPSPVSDSLARNRQGYNSATGMTGRIGGGNPAKPGVVEPLTGEEEGTEEYAQYEIEGFTDADSDNLSTFAADVDTASYAVVRKMLLNGKLPPTAAVRPEEFLNYFDYGYPEPAQGELFSCSREIAVNPFAPKRHFLRIGLQARSVKAEDRKPCHLTFLIDVSGSMRASDKLPLMKQAMRILVDNLSERDTVGICVYASSTGMVLPQTSASEKLKIMDAIEGLNAGGSTAMGAGIELAYNLASQNLVRDDVNRVVILTDGDANVGERNKEALLELIKEHLNNGVTLSVIGCGTGNYKDETLQWMADKGNGNYFYIDSLSQAKRVFGEELSGTMQVVAADMKLQVEFNKDVVEAFRLVGYETRKLKHSQFRDNKVDAGEVGSGHRVSAMYEVVLKSGEAAKSAKNLGVVRIRYKHATTDQDAVEKPFEIANAPKAFADATDSFKFATAVVGFADSLRAAEYAKGWRLSTALDAAEAGELPNNKDRNEFIEMVKKAISLRDK